MFNQLIESSTESQKTRRPFTLVLALAIHLVLIWALLLIPMVSPETLSAQLPRLILLAPPPPLGTSAPTPRAGKPSPVVVREHILQSPSQIPNTVEIINPLGQDLFQNWPISPSTGFPLGLPHGSDSVIGDPPGLASPRLQPPSIPHAPPVTHPVRIGGEVQQANLISQLKPQYPALAKQARIQGAVVLEAVISRSGTIVNLKVISGHPLLIQGALEAVRQWRYKPTLLNNEPVEVLTTITVNLAWEEYEEPIP
jgi:periplasmic protein TonB